MKLYFETKERAEELLRNAIAVWKTNYQIEDISGIEKDPVFMLFLVTLAYQEGEIESNWEGYKRGLFDDFFEQISPASSHGALPTTMILKSAPYKDIPSVDLGSWNSFNIKGSGYNFIPLFNTRLLTHTLKSISRIDGRRWKVLLSFPEPITTLKGFSFQILNTNFQDLKVTYKKEVVEVVKPWEQSDLPLADCFSINSLFYQQSQSFDTRMLWFDLFAESNTRLFTFKESRPFESDSLDLIFEFTSINKDFELNNGDIVFNTFPVVNATIDSVDLSIDRPIHRIEDGGDGQKEFISIIPDNKDLDFAQKVLIRKFNADRFGMDGFLKLINEIVQKFSSDFYAFQSIKHVREGGKIEQLNTLLNNIKDDLRRESADQHMTRGIYAILRNREGMDRDRSVKVKYLLYDNDVDRYINTTSNIFFIVPSKVNSVETSIVKSSKISSYNVLKKDNNKIQTRYNIATSDRIVTPSDIRHFVYKEFLLRYSVVEELISKVDIKHRLRMDELYKGHEIVIFISLKNSSYIQKKIAPNLSFIELLMQKMIENRSMGIYPIIVTITIEE